VVGTADANFSLVSLSSPASVGSVSLPTGVNGPILAVTTVQASNQTAVALELTCRLKLDAGNIGLAYSQSIPAGAKASLTVSGSNYGTAGQSVSVACSESSDSDLALSSLQGEVHVWAS
jgi:hypothetical protein